MNDQPNNNQPKDNTDTKWMGAGCEAPVESAVSGVEGVLEADASYDTGKATIKYDQSKTNRRYQQTGFTVKNNLNLNN